MQITYLSSMIMKNILRQRTIIFSSLILPIVIIWATWWVTIDWPMIFNLESGNEVFASMLDVHIVTGALTAMGITSGIFGFLITAELEVIFKRLKQVGYSVLEINISTIVVLFTVLISTATIATIFALNLTKPNNVPGLILATLLITMIYASLGNLVANIYPNITAGSLILLIFAFIDLMLVTNPMGENIYLQKWTYIYPGFWPTQIVLEAGFTETMDNVLLPSIYSLIYFVILIILSFIIKKLGLNKEVA